MFSVPAQASSCKSLNRTSVGLKPSSLSIPLLDRKAPQSNQRGIETGPPRRPRLGHKKGLNRTSVGLKQGQGPDLYTYFARPQSNQRGIETSIN